MQKALAEKNADIDRLEIELKAMRGAANSYKAEIERLKDYPKCVYEYDGDITRYCLKSPCSNYKTADEIKSESAKECLEWVLSLFPEDKNFTTISRFTINQRLKEMVGDAE